MGAVARLLGTNRRIARFLHSRLPGTPPIVPKRLDPEILFPALDSVGYAIWIADCDLRLRYANRKANEAAGLDEIWLGRDAASGAFNRRMLAGRLIAAACDGRSAGEILETRKGHRWSLFAHPLQPATGRMLALLSGRRLFAPAYDAAGLQGLFGLSPAQGRICELLVAGYTFAEAARRMGISVSTARTHFKEASARVGVSNLRQLLALIGSLPQVTRI